jgi:hypothetical protein
MDKVITQQWLVFDYLVVVGKENQGKYPFGISHLPTTTRVFSGYTEAGSECEAAVVALVRYFGAQGKETQEFVKRYSCKGSGVKIDNDLDGVQRKPAWIR